MNTARQGRYKITWLSNAVKAENNRPSVALGICEYSKKIAFMCPSDDALTLLLLHDLYIINGECEEGRRCLCRSCPHNKTTASSLGASSKRLRGIRAGQLENVHRLLPEIERPLKKEIESIDWREKQIILHFEKVPLKLAHIDSKESPR